MRNQGVTAVQGLIASQASTEVTPRLRVRFVRCDNVILIALPWLPFLSASPVLRVAGGFAVAASLLALLLARARSGRRSDGAPAAMLVLALLFVGAEATDSVGLQSGAQVAQLLMIALVLWRAPYLVFDKRTLRLCCMVCVGLSLIALIDIVWDPTSGNGLMFDNPNAYGVAGLCWAGLLLRCASAANRKARPVRVATWMILPVLVTVFSDSRASMAAVLVIVAWMVIATPLRNKAPTLRAVLPLLMLCIPIATIALISNGMLNDIADLLPTVGEKSPFSGRNIIWLDIFVELEANGYRGFGLGSLPGEILEGHYEGLSAHNGFMQIFYQAGATGLVVFLVLVATTLVAASKRHDNGASVAILLGALLHEMFEVALTQNHFGSGLLLWIVVMAPFVVKQTRRVVAG